MYIKFCRNYAADKKDEASKLPPHSKLSVELEAEKDKAAEGNTRWYRNACLLLLVLCLILLLIAIVLGLKLQTGAQGCPVSGEGLPIQCTREQCEDRYPRPKPLCRTCRQCPRMWRNFGDSCFFLSKSRNSWNGSQEYCESMGGSLAVVDSRDLQDFLTKEGNLQYWLGLKLTGNSWWWNTNARVRQSYWRGDASAGDCGILDAKHPAERNWVRAQCQNYAYFICQQLL